MAQGTSDSRVTRWRRAGASHMGKRLREAGDRRGAPVALTARERDEAAVRARGEPGGLVTAVTEETARTARTAVERPCGMEDMSLDNGYGGGPAGSAVKGFTRERGWRRRMARRARSGEGKRRRKVAETRVDGTRKSEAGSQGRGGRYRGRRKWGKKGREKAETGAVPPWQKRTTSATRQPCAHVGNLAARKRRQRR